MKKMHRKKFMPQIVLCALIAGVVPPSLYADGGKEFVTAHPMPEYPGSVPISDSDRTHRLSNDSLDKVRTFFKAHMQPDDRMEEFSKENETGFCLVYAEKAGNRELTARELCASKKVAAAAPKDKAIEQVLANAGVARQTVSHPAFDEMAAQVMKGAHSQAELQAAEKDYGEVATSYFRTIRDTETGKSVNQGDLIVRRAQKEAHPNQEQLKAAGKNIKVSAGDKAAAQEIKKQMQELKAKGDIAGMMQLAQNRKEFHGPPANQREAMNLAMDDRNRDTWAIWLKCLQELKSAAYTTKIEYGSGVLAE